MEALTFTPIGHICTDFSSKFGVPRQSGVVEKLQATVVFEPAYRSPEALRGLEGFSHLWLIWHFSQVKRQGWTPTVRPPRLGGNTRMGVFATRSPFRPNPIGLSSVRLEEILWDVPEGPALRISGADLMDGTPILDIKPYLAYTDSHPAATGGFVTGLADRRLEVRCAPALLELLPPEKQESLLAVLAHDPRPTYQADDGARVYGMGFAGFEVRFTVDKGILTVVEVEKDAAANHRTK